MSSIVIAGDTSGSVTLQAPAVSGSTVLNLPATSGTIQASGAGYTTNGVAYATSATGLATGSNLTTDGINLALGGAASAFGSGVSTLTLKGTGGTTTKVGAVYFKDASSADAGAIFLQDDSTYGFTSWNAMATGNYFRWAIGALGTEYMRLTSTGLGIGTSSPTKKLDILSNTSQDGIRISGSANPRLTIIDTTTPVQFDALCTDTEAVLRTDTNHPLVFSTNGTERMRLDSSGNLGLGVTPSAWTRPAIQGGASGTVFYLGATSTVTVSANLFYGGSNKYIGNGAATQYYQDAGVHVWENAASGTAGAGASMTERMRIDSSGNLLVASTNSSMTTGTGIKLAAAGGGASTPTLGLVGNSSDNGQGSYHLYSSSLSQYQFYVTYAGTIYARSTSITGLSDVSEKENIRDLETGLNSVLALQPRRFDWKNGSGTNVSGFIAQEVQSVLPDLVESYKISDEENKLGLKMGDMIPTLVKAIQEQQALITTLTERITALEGV